MTISPKTIEKMRSMKDEGYTNKEIAKRCKISKRTVGKKLKENNTVTSHNQHSITEKSIDGLEEQLQILELRPKVESELDDMICTIEGEGEIVLVDQLGYLQGKLENATDLKEIREIEKLISEDSDLLKKFNEAVDRWKEKLAKEEEEKRKKYDRRYNWLKSNLVKVIEDVNDIIEYPLTSKEIDDIIKETLPYGYQLGNSGRFTRRFTRVLKNFRIPEEHAKIISKWWIQKYCKWD